MPLVDFHPGPLYSQYVIFLEVAEPSPHILIDPQ